METMTTTETKPAPEPILFQKEVRTGGEGAINSVSATVHRTGTHSLSFNLYGVNHGCFYMTFTRDDFKAIADLLLKACAETEAV